MSDTKHCDVLAERFTKRAEAGLLDVKFFLQNREEAGPEEICQEINSLYDAVETGKAEQLNLGDFSWRDAPTG